MCGCKFCYLDRSKEINTVLEETDHFFVIPALGDFVGGYVLIVSKRHLYNMSELGDEEKDEYLLLIQKYREMFYHIYGKYPIVFEHGSLKEKASASSIVHAHTHVVNYQFQHEEDFIDQLNFQLIYHFQEIVSTDRSYIFYLSFNNNLYVTYDYQPISQLVRICIARDMGLVEEYNWTLYDYQENVLNTIKKISYYNQIYKKL